MLCQTSDHCTLTVRVDDAVFCAEQLVADLTVRTSV